MNSTKIQFCDSTANCLMGCDTCELWEVDGVTRAEDLCLPSRSDAPRKPTRICFSGSQHQNRGGKIFGFAAKFEQPTLFPGRIGIASGWPDLAGKARVDRWTKTGKRIAGKPWLDGHPRIVFIGDMGDSFSRVASFEYLFTEIISNVTSDKGRKHVWLLLTKRPRRMAAFSGWLQGRGIAWPPNMWAGTSITQQVSLDARIDALLHVGDARTVRFLSVEPQLEPLNYSTSRLSEVDWAIHGGASGTKDAPFPFRAEWARHLRDLCRSLGVAYFLKQFGEHPVEGERPLELNDPHGGDWDDPKWPADLRIREMPRLKSEARRQRVAHWAPERRLSSDG